MKFPFLHKRITPLLPITCMLFLLVFVVFFFFPPTTQMPLGFTSFSILYFQLFLIYLFFFGVGTLIFKTRTNGTLLALFILFFLILRLNDLKHPIFFIILAAFFITVEFFFSQAGKNTNALKKIEPSENIRRASTDRSPRSRRRR